jgi:hypothetical protein
MKNLHIATAFLLGLRAWNPPGAAQTAPSKGPQPQPKMATVKVAFTPATNGCKVYDPRFTPQAAASAEILCKLSPPIMTLTGPEDCGPSIDCVPRGIRQQFKPIPLTPEDKTAGIFVKLDIASCKKSCTISLSLPERPTSLGVPKPRQ